MADQKFVDLHNMVAFLEKPAGSDRFEQIVDFLNAHTIKYALTINPTIYTLCIKQFWATTEVKTVNEEKQLQALVDRKKVIITEATIRRDLHLEDAEGTDCLLNATIFEELTRMGGKEKVFLGESLSEGSEIPTNPHQTPTITQLSTSQPQKKQPRRKQRKDTKVPQPSDITEPIADEAPNEESLPTYSNDPLLNGVTLVDETQGRNDEEMFDTGILNGEEVFVGQDMAKKEVSAADPVTTASEVVTTVSTAATITPEEVTLAQALVQIKTSKPKAKGNVFKKPSESTTTTPTPTPTPIITPQQSSHVKDKVEEWYDIQAKIEADQLLAKRLQAREQEELTIDERAKLFQQILEKRRKFFAAKRVEENRNKPPTKAQQRSIMCTYLKNMTGWKAKDLKNKSFATIQGLFDKAMKRVNAFVDMDTELVEGSKKAEAEVLEESSKAETTDYARTNPSFYVSIMLQSAIAPGTKLYLKFNLFRAGGIQADRLKDLQEHSTLIVRPQVASPLTYPSLLGWNVCYGRPDIHSLNILLGFCDNDINVQLTFVAIIVPQNYQNSFFFFHPISNTDDLLVTNDQHVVFHQPIHTDDDVETTKFYGH
ncbi:hypothetical protein Tco_1371251 [Tanacetum coccineum]